MPVYSVPGYIKLPSPEESLKALILLMFILPITWPILIFIMIYNYNYDDKYLVFYIIMYFILIPLWLVLSPIGIPLTLIIFICFNNKK